ncbi:MAG: CHC2 zinc finger domain-containing protein [Verrucomicrobia bacterium]|nr:CHC2 zinc finger domain-containing protein [Verrucomicrobiota bacterium]
MKPPDPNEKAPARLGVTDAGRNQERPNNTAPAEVGKRNVFDDGTLEAMRCRLPEYLAARGVELTRQGARLVARCPVHDDTSPSFAVFPNGKNCGCFPCDFQGDVFAVSQWLGRASTFPEAVADVAATLGVYLSQGHAQGQPRAPQAPPRAEREPEVPFTLSPGDRQKIHAARLAFSDAFDAGGIDPEAAKLGLPPWVLRWAAMGESGLGWWRGRLAYIYPQGLKLRNPAGHEPRFQWECGRALAPWRFEWVRPETQTVFLSEGESDTLALIAAGLEADGTAACVAAPGTNFSREWAPMFAGRKVVLCFDSDPPGMTAAAKVAGWLAGHATEILTWKGPRA